MEPSSRRWLLTVLCVAAALLAALIWRARDPESSRPVGSAAALPAERAAPAPSSVALVAPSVDAVPAPPASDRVSGRVLDADGQPVASAQVGASAGDSPSQFTTAAADGSFALSGLSGSTVNIFATAAGFAAEHLRGVKVGSQGLVITLQAPATIVGRLAFAKRPSALYVRLCRFDRDFDREVCLKSRYYSPPEDAFELDRLPSGAYDLVFSSSDGELRRFPVTLRAGQTLRLDPVTL